MVLPCGAGAIGADPPFGCGFSRIQLRRNAEASSRRRAHDPGMALTYAVTWEEPDGSQRSGRLEVGPDLLRLDGRNAGLPVEHSFRYRDIVGYRMARGTGERLHGRPTLIVELAAGDSVKVASVAQSGVVSELANRLQAATSGEPEREKITSRPRAS